VSRPGSPGPAPTRWQMPWDMWGDSTGCIAGPSAENGGEWLTVMS